MIVTEGFPLTVDVETPCEAASGAVVVVEPDADEVAEPVLVARLTTREEVGTHSKLFELDELGELVKERGESDPAPEAVDDEDRGALVVIGEDAEPLEVEDELAPFEFPPEITAVDDSFGKLLSGLVVAENPAVEVCSGKGETALPPLLAVGRVPFV